MIHYLNIPMDGYIVKTRFGDRWYSKARYMLSDTVEGRYRIHAGKAVRLISISNYRKFGDGANKDSIGIALEEFLFKNPIYDVEHSTCVSLDELYPIL